MSCRNRNCTVGASLLALVIILAISVSICWYTNGVAREQGAEAYKKGWSEASNPWTGYNDRKAWIEGWHEAKAKKEGVK